MLARLSTALGPLRYITQDELVDFIVSQAKRPDIQDSKFNWDIQLVTAGFYPVFRGIDFAMLQNSIIEHMGTIPQSMGLHYSHLSFINCTNLAFLNGTNINYCVFENCDNVLLSESTVLYSSFTDCKNVSISLSEISNSTITHYSTSEYCINNSKLLDCITTASSSINNNDFTTYWPLSNCPLMKMQRFIGDQHLPLVVMIYMREHGTQRTDELFTYLTNKNINIVTVHPSDGFSHPIFKLPTHINGIILPGGYHIITNIRDYGQREVFEIGLIQYALEYQTPLLGVCRGHQMIGYYFGGTIGPLSKDRRLIDHGTDNNMRVSNITGSLFHQSCRRKHDSANMHGKQTSLQQNQDGSFSYTGSCMHSQEVTFPSGIHKDLVVTVESDDGCIEGIQVRDHIISFQHHHEMFTDNNEARGALRIFKNMVRNSRQRVNQPLLDPRPESTSLTL